MYYLAKVYVDLKDSVNFIDNPLLSSKKKLNSSFLYQIEVNINNNNLLNKQYILYMRNKLI